MVENHQYVIAQETMGIFLGRPFKVYVANFLTKPIYFIKYLVITYESVAPDYIVRTRGEEPSPKGQMKTDSCTISWCTPTKHAQEDATKMQKRNARGSSTNNLMS